MPAQLVCAARYPEQCIIPNSLSLSVCTCLLTDSRDQTQPYLLSARHIHKYMHHSRNRGVLRALDNGADLLPCRPRLSLVSTQYNTWNSSIWCSEEGPKGEGEYAEHESLELRPRTITSPEALITNIFHPIFVSPIPITNVSRRAGVWVCECLSRGMWWSPDLLLGIAPWRTG